METLQFHIATVNSAHYWQCRMHKTVPQNASRNRPTGDVGTMEKVEATYNKGRQKDGQPQSAATKTQTTESEATK
jgi:hypothetical protein